MEPILTPKISCFTPRVQVRRACSCPLLEMPASNSPAPAATVRTAQSAWEVPVITFLMKSLCPGASMMVTQNLLVPDFHREIAMVIPCTFSFQFVQDLGILDAYFLHFTEEETKTLIYEKYHLTIIRQTQTNCQQDTITQLPGCRKLQSLII